MKAPLVLISALTSLTMAVSLNASMMAQNVMLMNRIGPTASDLYVANADGSNEHRLLQVPGFDYHASFSLDGRWITFTSERSGAGQADIYRVHPDGTGLERLTDDPAMDDAGVLSPDGNTLAFVSTKGTHRANVWLLDLHTKRLRNLTGAKEIQGDLMKPDGFFKPAWSPDGHWIAFSSDRNTDWKGHDHNAGWEHIQELGIYVVHPDGSGLKRLTPEGITSGSPKFSPDGKQLVYYVTSVENTWSARVNGLSAKATSQVVSYDFASGKATELTSGDGLKLSPQMLLDGTVFWMTRAGVNSSVASSKGGVAKVPANLRSASWSPDGKQLVYEKVDYTPRPQYQKLYSWTPGSEYRYTDVFPSFAKDGVLVITAKDVDSSIVTENADGSNKHLLFKSSTPCSGTQASPCGAMAGVAFAPNWSPDGTKVVFGFGGYLQIRGVATAKILTANRDGSNVQDLTSGTPNAGFPSWSADGKEVVFRSWGKGEDGLRIINVDTKQIRTLTTTTDNLPEWSPDGSRILFTRKQDNNFDIYTIKPDGTDLKRLTDFPATDAHAVWSYDGKHILWNSGEYGFKDEAALYDNSFQPYGSIWMMNPDGSDKKLLTDSHWEDAMPAFLPDYALARIKK